MTSASMREIEYAAALHTFEQKQADKGLRPPLGTWWGRNTADYGGSYDKEVIERRREEVENLHRQGLPPRKISAITGFSIHTVNNDIYRIRMGQK